MIRISFQADITKLRREVADIREKQIPFATMLALNEVATEAQRQMQQQMPQRFDRPTPYTMNATFIRRATKKTLKAEVALKDEGFKGRQPRNGWRQKWKVVREHSSGTRPPFKAQTYCRAACTRCRGRAQPWMPLAT
jgi:hypothetical protein